MTATDLDLVLDGNAAAGLLREIFAPEPTAAILECCRCGATGAIGSLRLYAAPMGAILRCAHCHNVLMSVVSTPRGRWLEMSGARCLRF
jgi:hypothetical protein